MTAEEKRREEEKRERMYDPVQRWGHVQATIAFVEANTPPHLRRNVPRVPKWNPAVAARGGNSDRKTS